MLATNQDATPGKRDISNAAEICPNLNLDNRELTPSIFNNSALLLYPDSQITDVHSSTQPYKRPRLNQHHLPTEFWRAESGTGPSTRRDFVREPVILGQPPGRYESLVDFDRNVDGWDKEQARYFPDVSRSLAARNMTEKRQFLSSGPAQERVLSSAEHDPSAPLRRPRRRPVPGELVPRLATTWRETTSSKGSEHTFNRQTLSRPQGLNRDESRVSSLRARNASLQSPPASGDTWYMTAPTSLSGQSFPDPLAPSAHENLDTNTLESSTTNHVSLWSETSDLDEWNVFDPELGLSPNDPFSTSSNVFGNLQSSYPPLDNIIDPWPVSSFDHRPLPANSESISYQLPGTMVSTDTQAHVDTSTNQIINQTERNNASLTNPCKNSYGTYYAQLLILKVPWAFDYNRHFSLEASVGSVVSNNSNSSSNTDVLQLGRSYGDWGAPNFADELHAPNGATLQLPARHHTPRRRISEKNQQRRRLSRLSHKQPLFSQPSVENDLPTFLLTDSPTAGTVGPSSNDGSNTFIRFCHSREGSADSEHHEYREKGSLVISKDVTGMDYIATLPHENNVTTISGFSAKISKLNKMSKKGQIMEVLETTNETQLGLQSILAEANGVSKSPTARSPSISPSRPVSTTWNHTFVVQNEFQEATSGLSLKSTFHRVGGRRGHLKENVKQHAKIMRQHGACLRCKISKITVSPYNQTISKIDLVLSVLLRTSVSHVSKHSHRDFQAKSASEPI